MMNQPDRVETGQPVYVLTDCYNGNFAEIGAYAWLTSAEQRFKDIIRYDNEIGGTLHEIETDWNDQRFATNEQRPRTSGTRAHPGLRGDTMTATPLQRAVAEGCPTCGEQIEASVPIWLNIDSEVVHDPAASWVIYGISDDAAKVTCTEGHDCMTPELSETISRFIEARFPGTSWRDTAPVQ